MSDIEKTPKLEKSRSSTKISFERYSPQESAPHGEFYEVVIIGAGASGISAAKELEAKGIRNIIILEASGRVGGRINTLKPESGGFVDVGAQWIHGQDENALYSFAAPRGLIGEDVSVDGEGDFHTDDGEKLNAKFVSEVLGVCSKIKEECQNLASSGFIPPLSVGHYFRARFEEYLHSTGTENTKEWKLKEALYHWNTRWERIDNACDSLHQLSAKRWEYFACRGFYNMNPKFGMASIIHSMRSLVKAEVLLETEVMEINYARNLVQNGRKFTRLDGTNPIVVKCRNGKSFECDHVIVTCSLGYLKKHKHRLFNPTLPSLLAGAITNIGFGTIDKIFLEFEEPFWNSDFTGLLPVWTGNEIPNFDRVEPNTTLVDGRKLEPKDFWYRAISGFDPIYGHKSILCAWIGGPEAEFMEALSTKEVGKVCVDLLRRFTNNHKIPEPINVYRSQWAMDDYFLGSYSHRLVAGDHLEYDLIQNLNTPVFASSSDGKKVPLIVLAGEANNLNFYSTVHGAIGSGISQTSHYVDFIKSCDRSEDVAKSKL